MKYNYKRNHDGLLSPVDRLLNEYFNANNSKDHEAGYGEICFCFVLFCFVLFFYSVNLCNSSVKQVPGTDWTAENNITSYALILHCSILHVHCSY